MAKIPTTRRIVTEDFAEEYANLVSKLGYVLNSHMDDVIFAINGNIDFENLTTNKITITITMGPNNKPLLISQVKVGVDNPIALQVISVTNLTNNKVYPTSQPFISFSNIGGGIVTIDNITGLPEGYKYVLNIVVY